MKCIQYQVDANDSIIHLGQGWREFAESNQTLALDPQVVLGKNLYDYIVGWECRHIYKNLFRRVRERSKSASFPFRCDAPDKRRYMIMRLEPLPDDNIEIVSCVVREEHRSPVRLLDADAIKSEQMVKICSWCKRIEVSESRWKEAEEAIDILNLFDAPLMPALTHGMCTDCYESINRL